MLLWKSSHITRNLENALSLSRESGGTFRELKATFGIDRNTFVAWVKIREEAGAVVVDRLAQERKRKIDKEKWKKIFEGLV